MNFEPNSRVTDRSTERTGRVVRTLDGNTYEIAFDESPANSREVVPGDRLTSSLFYPVMPPDAAVIVAIEPDAADPSKTLVLWRDPAGGEPRVQAFRLPSARRGAT